MAKRYGEKDFKFMLKDGTELTIYCWTTDTRNGFCHTAELWGVRSKISYLNRTWERFEYESVIYSCIEKNFGLKSQEADRAFLREQVDRIAERGAFEAEQWFENMKSIYDGLHENTKQHMANALKDSGPLDKEQIEQTLAISQVFDLLMNS